MALSYLRTPTIERLPVLMEWLRTGELRIPPFQREIVWDGEQRLSLCDTIRRGLPIGSLMVWRTNLEIDVRGFHGPFELKKLEPSPGTTRQYLLDGLQRMTTLFAALGPALWTREGQVVPWRDTEGVPSAPDETPWAIGFDVAREDGDFVLFDTPQANDTILPLEVMLDDEAYDRWRATDKLDRAQKNRARAVRTAFVDYLIPVAPLATDSLEAVTLTFKRINTGGTKMGAFDMNRALSWRDDFDLRQTLEDKVNPRLEPLGWVELSQDDTLKVIATAYGLEPVEISSETLAQKIVAESAKMDIVADSLVWAIGVLDDLGFKGPATLPYSYLLVFAARAWQDNKGALDSGRRAKLVTWLAEAAMTERLGAKPPHMIRAAWNELTRHIGLSADKSPKSPVVGKVRASGQTNFGWARPVITAAVLGLQQPRRGDNTIMDDAGRRLGEVGKVWFPQLVSAPEARKVDTKLRTTAANHVVCDPHELEALRVRLRQADCPKEILESHAISKDAHAFLLEGKLKAFFVARFATIVGLENKWLQSHNSDLRIELSPVQQGPS